MESRGRELRDHAVIAGLVAAAIVVFEVRFHDAVEQKWHWLAFAGLFAVYIAAFFLIWLFDLGLEWVHKRERVRLGKAGIVDGDWIDGIWDGQEGHLIMGSIVNIKSTPGRFEISGISYRLDGTRVGGFTGWGVKWEKNILSFAYDGEEATPRILRLGRITDDRPDFGVGYYKFVPPHAGNANEFSGYFLSTLDRPVRRVQGKRADLRGLDDARRAAKLTEYLRELAAADQPAAPGEAPPAES